MREWSAHDVRLRIESELLPLRHRDVEILGTLVPDDAHLTVLVRSRRRGSDGEVQSLTFDLDYLYESFDPRTLEVISDEVSNATLNFPSMNEVGVDSSGIRHWD